MKTIFQRRQENNIARSVPVLGHSNAASQKRTGSRSGFALTSLLCPGTGALLCLAALLAFAPALHAEELDAAVQAKLDARVKQIEALAADPVIVKAVKAQNTAMPAELAALDQDKWKTLGVLDPLVRSFSKNDAGQLLKTKKSADVSEAFVSAANGTKVAFLNKTSSWSHKGKPKHDVPMTGKNWQGAIEVDDSTGLRQVQVAVPVLEEGKPIGSLVVGLDLSKLKSE